MKTAPDDCVELVMNGSQVIRVPRRFDRYEYIRALGSGCSSAVVLVRNVASAALFACKVVPRARLAAEGVFERFEQEARLLAGLRHPNIVQFEEVVFGPELVFLVMEYCPQGDLFTRMVMHGIFGEARAREILQQIAEAVRFVHGRDIAHRDLKPENILLDAQSTAKLADFGLCHTTSPTRLLCTPCGSPFYAAPEVISHEEYNGKSADIWSLGILLFTMVTGSLPWSSENRAEMFRQITACEVCIPPTLSPALQDLLASMLQRDPQKRFTIEKVLNSPWFSKPKNEALRASMRHSSWMITAEDAPAQEEPKGAAAPNPPERRRLIMRPGGTKPSAVVAASLGIVPIARAHIGRRSSIGETTKKKLGEYHLNLGSVRHSSPKTDH
jgi:serine/threonine protein kinase